MAVYFWKGLSPLGLPTHRQDNERFMVFWKIQNPDQIAVVKGAHNACRKPESLALKENVLADVPDFDVRVPDTPVPVFDGNPFVFARQYQL